MKTLLVIAMTAALIGCGTDVATTAATSASVKKREMEAAQQTKERAQQKIDQATQAIQQSADQAGNVDK